MEIHHLPEDKGIEVALCGRSNSGKSSVLNALADNKYLARISKTPGRTQSLNVFDLCNYRLKRIVDLPGYGFAKASKQDRKSWGVLVNNYLNRRLSLKGLILIMDIRRPLRDSDLTLINWCKETHTNILIILNKSDKLSKNQSINALKQTLGFIESIELNINAIIFSAKNLEGMKALKGKLTEWMDLEESPNTLG